MTTTFTSSVLPPHERGVEGGAAGSPAEVAEPSARYRRLFTTRAGGTFDVDLWSVRAWATIERVAPVHAEEIAGIAAGAGLTVEQVASVNARTEILVAGGEPHRAGRVSTVVQPPGRPCRSPSRPGTGTSAMADGWFDLHHPAPRRPGRATVTEFGKLAKIGVNDRGVGVMLNMLHHRRDAGAVATGEIGHPVTC